MILPLTRIVLNALSSAEVATVCDVCRFVGCSAATAGAALDDLELAGWLERHSLGGVGVYVIDEPGQEIVTEQLQAIRGEWPRYPGPQKGVQPKYRLTDVDRAKGRAVLRARRADSFTLDRAG
jgi:hypothetical protein